MPALRYQRLDRSKKTIRLLTVLPGDEREPIRCELTHADLDDRPPYIALSYTWDHDGRYDELECNGVVIQASKNLCDFLRQFRLWDAALGIQLWVDAICTLLPVSVSRIKWKVD
jgi:hypothetical protein